MKDRCYENENNTGCCMEEPICECPREQVCDKYIIHEVPHIIPMNTKIINHHIFKHTYTPYYTSCEVNTCENVFDGYKF